MKVTVSVFGAVLLTLCLQSEASARGFGFARGGFGGGFRGGYLGGARGGLYHGPYGGFGGWAARGGTYVGPRGTTVRAGQVGGIYRGPLGGYRLGGAEGARVTTPGGRTFTTGSLGGVRVGPYGGVRAGGVHGAAVVGPYGAAGDFRRGGVALRPYGGVAIGGTRVGAIGRVTRYISPATMRYQAGFVRGGFYRGAFTTGWYRAHPGVWYPARWRVANVWLAPTWLAAAGYCGITAAPLIYDYGSNVVIDDGDVYVDGAQVATAQQYAQQAVNFAAAGRQAQPAENDEWQPLGVFGMIQGDEKIAQNIFQLALDKKGVIRGNYYNAVADNTLPVYGSVDPKSQRAAWSIGDKKDIVFETGLNNLTQKETTVLVHYGKERTEQMILIRLPDPGSSGKTPEG
jgi:hypothetical protein